MTNISRTSREWFGSLVCTRLYVLWSTLLFIFFYRGTRVVAHSSRHNRRVFQRQTHGCDDDNDKRSWYLRVPAEYGLLGRVDPGRSVPARSDADDGMCQTRSGLNLTPAQLVVRHHYSSTNWCIIHTSLGSAVLPIFLMTMRWLCATVVSGGWISIRSRFLTSFFPSIRFVTIVIATTRRLTGRRIKF